METVKVDFDLIWPIIFYLVFSGTFTGCNTHSIGERRLKFERKKFAYTQKMDKLQDKEMERYMNRVEISDEEATEVITNDE